MGGLLMPQEIKPCDNSSSIVLEDISGTNPDEVAVWGESVGGYLTAMTGTTNGEEEFEEGENLDQSSDVQAAIVGANHGGGHFSDPKVIKIMVDFLDKALK